MKIRHPALIGLAGLGISWAVRLWVGGTVRYRCHVLDAGADPLMLGQTDRFIYSFWHETLLMPAWQYRRTPTDVLISDHADGEMIPSPDRAEITTPSRGAAPSDARVGYASTRTATSR